MGIGEWVKVIFGIYSVLWVASIIMVIKALGITPNTIKYCVGSAIMTMILTYGLITTI